MLAGIQDELLISLPWDSHVFVDLLGDGSDWDKNFQYEIQIKPLDWLKYF